MRGKPNNLNNEEPEKKENAAVPDFADEAFWQDFSRQLRRLLEPADAPPTGENAAAVPDAATARSGTERQTEQRQTRRSNNCLSFSRCAEIGRAEVSSAAERSHLEICRFCVRRVEQFGVNPPPAVPKIENVKIEAKIAPLQPPQKSFWARLFPLLNDDSKTRWSPTAFGLAGLAAILFGGLAFVVWQLNFNQPETDIADLKSAANAKPPLPNADFPANENVNAAVNAFAPANSGANNSPSLPKNGKETAANENTPNNQNADESAINFGAIPAGERAAVRESWRTGEITPSADLARLQNVPTRRSGNDHAAPISPRSDATLAPAPVFLWQAATNTEYQITVTDDAGREVAKSAILSQNSWQIEKELPAGFYFWKVSTRQKDVEESAKNSSPAMFKVLSQVEKRELEAAKNSVKSNLVSAVLNARAGLLAEAERELNLELRKNPNSAKARKMLAQVRDWRRK